jgi:opacity protein-like surface antigen
MKKVTVFVMSAVLCAFVVSAASAQTSLGLRSIGFGVGVVDPEDVDMTVGFGFYGNLGYLHPNVNLESFVGYWQQTEDMVGGGEVVVRDFAMVMRAKYMFDITNSTIRPFAGGGLGFHVVNAGIDVPDMDIGGLIVPGYSQDDTEIKLGLDLGGGMLFDINPGVSILTDAWYSIVSDVSQLSLRAGIMFKLGG